MDDYQKIWKSAKKYYKKGRPMDIAHISWMIKQAKQICKKEKVDDSILIPLVILHDIGYSVSKKAYFQKNMKKEHMTKGAIISRKILSKINYPEEKIRMISNLIKVHDYWIFGRYDLYKKNKILWIFNDLDFIWLSSPKGFNALRRILGKTKEEMIDYIKEDIRHKKQGFSCKSTKKIYQDYIDKLSELYIQ